MAQRPYFVLDSSKVMSNYNVRESDFRNGIKIQLIVFYQTINHET